MSRLAKKSAKAFFKIDIIGNQHVQKMSKITLAETETVI